MTINAKLSSLQYKYSFYIKSTKCVYMFLNLWCFGLLNQITIDFVQMYFCPFRCPWIPDIYKLQFIFSVHLLISESINLINNIRYFFFQCGSRGLILAVQAFVIKQLIFDREYVSNILAQKYVYSCLYYVLTLSIIN